MMEAKCKDNCDDHDAMLLKLLNMYGRTQEVGQKFKSQQCLKFFGDVGDNA